MKNKIIKITVFLILIIFNYSLINAEEIINFNITEIEIKDEGKTLIGNKRGTVSINDGSKIESDTFTYDKLKNKIIFSGNVIAFDKKNDLKIFSDFIEYDRELEIISSYGKTKVLISSNYVLNSEDLVYNKKKLSLNSIKKSYILDNYKNYYSFENFEYLIESETLRAENIFFENQLYEKNNSDKLFFKSGLFNLKDKNFQTKDAKIKFNKSIFGDSENDPRLYAVSAKKTGNLTKLNKAIFTSCKLNDNCPPWSLKANKITHDKNKKILIYDKAILQIYDVPVLYFPKFFHPDPTVNRQSGFLTPFLNKSNITGSSLQLPYYLIISENQDITFKPTLFNNNKYLMQNEYRYKGKKSSFSTDLGYVKGYKSSSLNNKEKNISHIFAKYDVDLGLLNFNKSNLSTKLERTNNDTYLKVFGSNLANTINLPSDPNVLSSEVKLQLNHDKYDLVTGFNVYENLQLKKNDRFQYILPYYKISKNFFENIPLGYINFESKGDNNINNTNILKTKILNSLNYNSYNFYSQKGFVNNFGLYFKNFNIMAKNDEVYKSSPQSKIMGLVELNSSIPLQKTNKSTKNNLVPKISLKINPGDMENYSNNNSKISYSNIFDVNRIGIEENFESGNSLTYGLEYKKEDLENTKRFFSLNMASVYRTKEEKNIPTKSTLDNKNSNYFGSFNAKWDDLIEFKYDFSIDNNLSQVEYNSAELNLNKNKFFTNINYVKEKGAIGVENIIKGSFGYEIDQNNNLKFETRRNKKIGLTEYYDLIYEYRNDCLTAGIKYQKLYYSDRDVKPSENLLFSITLFPITSVEQMFSSN